MTNSRRQSNALQYAQLVMPKFNLDQIHMKARANKRTFGSSSILLQFQPAKPVHGMIDNMDHTDTSALFEPITIRSLTIPNRLVIPSMQVAYSKTGGPTPKMHAYFRERLEGGFGLLLSESCAVDHPAATGQSVAVRMTEETQPGWARLISELHQAGGNFLIQLWHEGAARRWEGPLDHPAASISPAGVLQKGIPMGRAATREDLESLRDAYVRSARLSKAAGADGVEIHAAHGYLLDQFLWDEANLRTDEYGGPEFSNRLRFPSEIVKAVREEIGPDMVLSFRFSQWKNIDYNARLIKSAHDLKLMVETLENAGVDMFNVSVRRFYEPAWAGTDRTLAGWTKKLARVPVITIGSIGLSTEFPDLTRGREGVATPRESIELLMKLYHRGEFDLVAIGRSSIGDGHWARKIRERRFDEIKPFRIASALPENLEDWDMWVSNARKEVQKERESTDPALPTDVGG